MEFPVIMEQSLDTLCEGCTSDKKEGCREGGCLVGFCKKCLDSYNSGNGPKIQNGLSEMPTEDMKVYDREDAARVVAVACKWCHNCEDSHTEDCVVSLCRRAMEVTATGKEINYKGSSLVYLRDLDGLDAEFSSMVLEEYKNM